MSQRTINPYAKTLTDLFTGGLDYVIDNIPSSPTADDLVDTVATYIEGEFYTTSPPVSKQVHAEIIAIAYNTINSYQSNLVTTGGSRYNNAQAPFINLLIGPNMTANTSPDSVLDVIADIEDNVGVSRLSVQEQTPLFMATLFGSTSCAYWAAQIAPQSPAATWSDFLSNNAGQNYMNVLQWSVATMNGTLAAYGASTFGMVEPTNNMVSNQIISALLGALTISAGKVIFNWNSKIAKPLQLDLQSISSFSNGGNVTPGHFAARQMCTTTSTCLPTGPSIPDPDPFPFPGPTTDTTRH